jgi:hypothetical protein
MSYTPPLEAEVTAFATTASLAATATYDSSVDWDGDVNGYTQVQTEITSDMDGTLVISFCSDSLFANEVRGLSIPYTGGSGYQFFAAPAFANFIKYSFTNNGVGANTIYLTTKLTTTAVQPQLLTTNAFIAEAMVASLGRNLLVGQNDGGQFKNVRIDNQQHLEVNASNPKTAYDELPVANYSPVAQISFPYNINPDIVSVTETAGGTVVQATNMAVLNTSATTASSAMVTSIGQVPFRAGQGHIGRLSCLFDGVPTSTGYMGIGLGDADNGYGFLLDSAAFNISYRTNGVPQPNIPQTTWNVDKMDGAGPSGMTLDVTKGNAYQISYGDGFGCINFSIESATTGDYVLVHILHIANLNTTPSTYNSTFPLRAEVSNGGGTADLTLSVASMSGFIEGEDKVTGPLQAYAFTPINVTTIVPLFTLSNLTTFAGITNKVNALLKSISLVNDTNGAGTFKLIENGTLTGAGAYTPISAGTSVMAVDTAASAVTGGRLLWAGGVQKDGGDSIDISGLELLMHPGNFYTFTAETLGGSNPMAVNVVWQEDF